MLIQPYKESWVVDFDSLKRVLEEALAGLPISVEHVGSTSVPGLAAKPIIDVDLVVDQRVAIDDIKSRLTKVGYYHNGNQGIPGREVFKRGQAADTHPVLDLVAHHLYACRAASDELRRHRLFRDYLIADDEVRIQYQTLKYALAHEANQDRKHYALLKELKATAFISRIIERAGQSEYDSEQ
jgi:GrpB-like predicted nucleotidyltransferase (UPF0157 family)